LGFLAVGAKRMFHSPWQVERDDWVFQDQFGAYSWDENIYKMPHKHLNQ
jgi:hypothetical protein